MRKLPKKQSTTVREHPRKVPASAKNPNGVTLVDRHTRRLKSTYLSQDEIDSVFKSYDRGGLIWPTPGKLGEYKNADKFDELIAVWTDYFNKKFATNPPLGPDVVKALIARESGFRLDPPENKAAFGIAQITKATWKILQDSEGEAKSFIFDKVRQRDLKDPVIAIPMAVRWLSRKTETARGKLGHAPNPEELILEYKGLLKSRSQYRDNALEKFREAYGKLKKK